MKRLKWLSALPLERIRFYCLVAGTALLFWQHDAAASDWLFGLAILLSVALVPRRLPGFDLDWPQPLLVLFLAVTAAATGLAGGSLRFFAITIYLALLALAIAAALRHAERRWIVIQDALVAAAAIASVLVVAGALYEQIGWSFLEPLAYDKLRGKGLFKDPNVAGAFIACTYPLAAATAMRHRRYGVPALIGVTALIGLGAVFSFSRLALVLLGLGMAATFLMFAMQRRWAPIFGVAGLAAVLGVATPIFGDLPLYRYQLIQPYDERGRFLAWALAVEMIGETPLGIGSGSFEAGFGRQMEQEFEKERERLAERGSKSDNLIRNGAMVDAEGWKLLEGASTEADPSSPTGYALRKETTAAFQDPSQAVPVVPGQRYSFAAQIRTDGTRALLIVHWRDSRGATLRQDGTRNVSAQTWTEVELVDQVAPLFAKSALVHLSNRDPGVQHFTAVRVVPGTSVPPWSAAMQRSVPFVIVDFAREATAAHNIYLRVAVESGLPGLLLLVAYLLLLAWAAWTALDRERWQWAVAFSLVLIAGFVIDTLHWRQLWVYAGVLAALKQEAVAPAVERASVGVRPFAALREMLRPSSPD